MPNQLTNTQATTQTAPTIDQLQRLAERLPRLHKDLVVCTRERYDWLKSNMEAIARRVDPMRQYIGAMATIEPPNTFAGAPVFVADTAKDMADILANARRRRERAIVFCGEYEPEDMRRAVAIHCLLSGFRITNCRTPASIAPGEGEE